MLSKFVVDVVLLRKLPAELAFFSYLLPPAMEKDVHRGSMIQVSFRNKQLFGIVKHIRDVSNNDTVLKEVLGVTSLRLTSQQMKLTKYLATLYYESEASLYRYFVAPEPMRKHLLKTPIIEGWQKGLKPRLKSQVKIPAYALFEKYEYIFAYIQKIISLVSESEQVLIIIPEVHLLRRLAGYLQDCNLVSDILIIPLQQKKNSYYIAWSESQSKKIIIGTQKALFLPYSNLRYIIILEAEHHLFQSAERSPRLHLADYIFELSAIYKASLIVSGFSPDISLLHQARNKLPLLQLALYEDAFSIINMKDEREKKNFALLSEKVQSLIAKKNMRILLLLNRFGENRLLQCEQCSYLVSCISCRQSMILDASHNKLICLHCSQYRVVPLVCPRCTTAKLRLQSNGLSKLKRELSKLLPSKRIIEISSRSKASTKDIATSDIVIATNRIFSYPDLRYDHSVVINADSELQFPNHHAAERLRHSLFKLKAQASQVHIQTYNPQHYVFTSLTNVKDFYRSEISSRKQFRYPPFAIIIKLSIRDKDEHKYKNKLQKLLIYFAAYTLLGPYTTKTKSLYQAHIIIKVPSISDELDQLLKRSYNWIQLEINPYNLL